MKQIMPVKLLLSHAKHNLLQFIIRAETPQNLLLLCQPDPQTLPMRVASRGGTKGLVPSCPLICTTSTTHLSHQQMLPSVPEPKILLPGSEKNKPLHLCAEPSGSWRLTPPPTVPQIHGATPQGTATTNGRSTP